MHVAETGGRTPPESMPRDADRAIPDQATTTAAMKPVSRANLRLESGLMSILCKSLCEGRTRPRSFACVAFRLREMPNSAVLHSRRAALSRLGRADACFSGAEEGLDFVVGKCPVVDLDFVQQALEWAFQFVSCTNQ